MERVIKIGSKEVNLKATAGTPRLYRMLIHRDLMIDMKRLGEKLQKNINEGTEFDNLDLTIFENVAYVMAKHADKSIQKNVEDWLDEFDFFDIYNILPEILDLWNIETDSQIESKKNFNQVIEK